jgi:glutathione S-transferase
MIRIHGHPFSTYTRRVMMALQEKRIPHEFIAVDMVARKHRDATYLASNPYGRVPLLEEDGFLLFESNAILSYLEATHPEPALVPADPKGRALVDMHLRLCDIQFSNQVGTIIFPKRFLPKERWDTTAMANAKVAIEKHLAIVDQQLAGKEYMVGNRFSLVEISYGPFLDFLPLMEVQPPANVADWTRRVLSRPCAEKTKPAQ